MTTATPSVLPDGMVLPDGTAVFLRTLHPDDEALYPQFHAAVSARDRRLRFFSAARVSDQQIHRLTHYDPAEAVVRAAIGRDDGQLYGVSRLHRIEGRQGEFAVMVRSDHKGQGLGRLLLEQALALAPTIGVGEVVGLILPENVGMLALATELGFTIRPDLAEPGVVRASLELESPTTDATRRAA